VPAYDSRNGSSVNFTFPSFSSGESKTFTYSAKTWIPPSRAKNFTVYDMVAKKQAAPPEAEPPKPAQPAETPVELPPVAPQVKQPSKQPAPSAPKAIIYGKPDDTLPFALAALALATACALIVYYFTRGKDGKQGPAAPPGRPPGA